MEKITNAMVEKSYEVGKRLFNSQILLKDGIGILNSIGMNEKSAVDYVYNYKNLMEGKMFTRTTNVYATEYYLKKIYEESGIVYLQNALLSLSQHFDYYEDKSRSKVKKKRSIYNFYLDLVNQNAPDIIFPDDLDGDIQYPEGKAKKVLVNAYERNPIARKKCIEHYGLNCKVCDYNFEMIFGILGANFIHVHHVVDISSVGNEYSVDPINDLVPVCPNCHSMLHKKKPAYSITELKKIMNSQYNIVDN